MLEVRPKTRGTKTRRSKPKWPKYVMSVCVLVVLTVAVKVAYHAQRVTAAAAAHVQTVPEEIQVGQQMIRQNIRDEFKSTFGPVEETVVEKMPEDKIRVSGWVDVMLENGVSDRQNYSIIIFRNGAGEWVGERATVLPQM